MNINSGNDDHAPQHGGGIVPAPTTDEHGEPTSAPQAKILAALSGAGGGTLIAVVLAAATGIQLDPVAASAVAGVLATVLGTLFGYLTRNTTKAN